MAPIQRAATIVDTLAAPARRSARAADRAGPPPVHRGPPAHDV